LLVVLLGGVYGIPKSLVWATCATFWCRSNKKRIVDEDVEENFEDLERKSTKLATGINYDFYESKKTSGQTMLFLHGFPDSASSWRPLMSKMSSQGYHCLAPNQRGYGRSSKPRRKELFHINFLITDIASFVEQKANEKKVILVIHDWGSAVGFEFARTYPDMVEKIVGINSPSLPGMQLQYQSNPSQLLKSFYIFCFQFPFIPEMIWRANDYAMIKYVMQMIGTPAGQLNRCIRGMGLRDDPATLTCAINWYRANFGENMYEKMKIKPTKIAKDTLILWGDKDVALSAATPDYERKFISAELKVVHFPLGNHNLFHSHLDECFAEIVDFLK